MKITIKMEKPEELDTFLRIRTGITQLVNWLELRWNKNDIQVTDTEEGLLVEGDSKYENELLEIIEDAKNGAYEMM